MTDGFLIAGLGNPGSEYISTRHNIGFMVVDKIAADCGINLKKSGKFNAEFCKAKIKGINVILAKPLGYMNRSGEPVRRISDYFTVEIKNVMVIHDDMDIEFGFLKLKQKGGDGGHKGLKSLIAVLKSDNFIRIRTGIGRPELGISVTDYVLGSFNIEETERLNSIIKRAGEATITVVCKGINEGMNRFNKGTVISN